MIAEILSRTDLSEEGIRAKLKFEVDDDKDDEE